MEKYKQLNYGSWGGNGNMPQVNKRLAAGNITKDEGRISQPGVRPKDQMQVSTMGATDAQTQAPEEDVDYGASDPGYEAGGSGYEASDAVRQAQELLQQHLENKPGDYSSLYADQIQAILDQIMNRDEFSYNLNEDALYRQYADQYTRQGKMAMMDAMGQAAAMTGGYGSSYGQMVGQQAYQGYLQQLNEVMPELYGMAFDRYQQEGHNLLNQYGMLTSQEEQEYGRYRDQVSDYYAELDRLTEDARYVAEDEYGKWIDERNYEYQQGRDAVSDEQWQAEFDEEKRRYEEQTALEKEQWAWEKAQYERAQKENGGSGSGGIGESGYELEHVASMSSEAIVSAMQNYNAAEDDTGLAAFLDDLVATRRIDEATADKWYREYKSQKDEDVTDTTVDSGKKENANVGGGGFSKDPFVRVPWH